MLWERVLSQVSFKYEKWGVSRTHSHPATPQSTELGDVAKPCLLFPSWWQEALGLAVWTTVNSSILEHCLTNCFIRQWLFFHTAKNSLHCINSKNSFPSKKATLNLLSLWESYTVLWDTVPNKDEIPCSSRPRNMDLESQCHMTILVFHEVVLTRALCNQHPQEWLTTVFVSSRDVYSEVSSTVAICPVWLWST